MFFARPISLKTEVWDRIDAYMNEYATTHRDFTPNRSAFIEECIIAYLDAKDAEASGASSDTDTSLDDLGLDTESTGDTDTDESTGDTSSEETSDDSGLDADAADEDAAAEASEDEPAEEEAEAAEAPKPAKRKSSGGGKKSAKKAAKKPSKRRK